MTDTPHENWQGTYVEGDNEEVGQADSELPPEENPDDEDDEDEPETSRRRAGDLHPILCPTVAGRGR